MGDGLGVFAPFAQDFGETGEFAGGFFGDVLWGLRGLEGFGLVEEGVQPTLPVLGQQIVEGDGVDALDGVGEVGVYENGVDVGYDEEGRVLQGLAVLEQLLIGFVEVGVFAFVLPGEVVFFPDVGPALAAASLGRAGFEGEGLAGGVFFGGGGVADEAAEVDEVLLAGGAFFEGGVAPFVDEVLG